MFWTYLRRELSGRKKHTVIVSIGLAIAVALVIIVNALSTGVKEAQTESLQAVYGVGTDLTVTGAQAEPGEGGQGGPQFDFGEGAGETNEDGTTTLDESTLSLDRGRGTLEASVLDTIDGVDGVEATTATLSLTNSTFSGEIPQADDSSGSQAQQGTLPDAGEGGMGGGFGGGSFGLDSFTVLGIDPSASEVGPMTSVSVSEGRLLDADDAGQLVAVLDSTYAASAELAVGDTIELGGTEFEIIGTVASTEAEADTSSNVYISLDVAQELSGSEDAVSTVYVQAASSDQISTVQSGLEEALPDATVSSQSDLASTVSGSLNQASSLITNLGTWLSVIVLLVAVGLAVLFTLSGITRRTRELGTLKSIGWSNRRIIRQVAGESMVQSLIGGVAGLALGLVGILTVNLISPTISSSTATGTTGGEGMAEAGAAAGEGGMPGGGALASVEQAATEIVLNAPLNLWMLALALGLAVAAGLVAGVIGGWRAAKLQPAEALRSVG